MTAASTPARARFPRTERSVPGHAARLLRLELRRNPWPWLVPLLAVLVWFDTYRTAMSYAAVWTVRASVIGNHLVPNLLPFAAGVCAWAGSRDGRRNMTDLLTATARPVWARRGAVLAATFAWVLGVYLVFVAVLYVVTAQQATWGGPPLWPVAVGAAELAAACAVGFAAGVFVPSRFTAPIAAVGSFLALIVAFKYALGATGGDALLSPMNSVPNVDAGVFYRIPDLSIAQVMFLGGIAVALAGILGLPAAGGGRVLRGAAAVVTLVGLAAAGTSFGLASTARQGAYGVVIPALHDAASDRPVPYTPVCGRAAGVPVCVHPAFRAYLQDVTTALGPVLAEVAGLPGAPTRVSQIASTNGFDAAAVISGTPPVLGFTTGFVPAASSGRSAVLLNGGLGVAFMAAFVTSPGFVYGGNPTTTTQPDRAQEAVAAGLLADAGVPLSAQPWAGSGDSQFQPVRAAAQRFAALPAAARRAWLSSHLAALRAGHLTPPQLP
jgi:hypothetical protein